MSDSGKDDLERGSYDFGRFAESELSRLVAQGSATWPQERALLEWAGLRSGQRVLDVGCGPGVISGHLATVAGSSGSVVGVDINNELLSVARQLNGDRVEHVCASIYDLSRFAMSFDFVYVRLVFQHVAQPDDAMRQVLSTLKPGGYACVFDSDETMFGIYPPHPEMYRVLADTQRFQQQRGGDRFVGGKLAFYMRSAGFESVEPRVFLSTPELTGLESFLDAALTWRPLLYPEDNRGEATRLVEAISEHAMRTMISGHNGAFVVKGMKPM